jgi:hypothetical protein
MPTASFHGRAFWRLPAMTVDLSQLEKLWLCGALKMRSLRKEGESHGADALESSPRSAVHPR